MLRLEQSLRAWGTAGFEAAFKHELTLHAGLLPLQQGLTHSSSVADASITAVVYSMRDQADAILVKTGIFYQGLIGGCNCADDPTPGNTNNEHCVVELEIDKKTAMAKVTLLAE